MTRATRVRTVATRQVADDGEELDVGSVLEVDIFGYTRWGVAEVRPDQGPLLSAVDSDGTPLPFGGTLVCRGVTTHHACGRTVTQLTQIRH